MKSQLQNKDDTSEVSQSASTEVSPDSRCPICIDRFDNMAYVNCCLHKFCFSCIHEWSKNKAECPLCKQPFNSIYHSIKNDNDFEEFVLESTENSSPGSPDDHQFRTLTRQIRERRQTQRRASPPLDDVGVLEGPLQLDTAFRHILTITSELRRRQNESRMIRHLRERDVFSLQHPQYRMGVRVRSIRGSSRYSDNSPAFFQRNLVCPHRLLPRLRHATVMTYGTHGSLDNIMQHIIMPRVTRIPWNTWPTWMGYGHFF